MCIPAPQSPKTTPFESEQPMSSLLKQLFHDAALIDAVYFCAHHASFVGIAPIAVDSKLHPLIGEVSKANREPPRRLVCV